MVGAVPATPSVPDGRCTAADAALHYAPAAPFVQLKPGRCSGRSSALWQSQWQRRCRSARGTLEGLCDSVECVHIDDLFMQAL